MKSSAFHFLAIAVGLGCAAIPAIAHHSFAAEFDSKKPVKVTGAVTKVEWMNPHIYYYVDVKGPNGATINYAIEGGTPGSLYRQGWRKNSLRIGDSVTVEGFMAKNGTARINGRKVTLPDGTRVFGGSSDDGGPDAEYRDDKK
jgi:hypothetical protein